MDDLTLLIDLHRRQRRQGPGGEDVTKLAMELAGLPGKESLKIADIGCGTGASTLQVANSLDAKITAVDFLPDFINALEANASVAGLSDRIETLVCSMEELPFAEKSYDVLWSEGAIYNMGFENGVKSWRRFLKTGGLLIVSEITWITHQRPPELQQYWDGVYPETATAAEKTRILEQSGYSPLAYFVLPQSSWLDNYYRPLQHSFPDFLARNARNEGAASIVEAEEKEIALYEKYKNYFSYGMYIARAVVS